MRTGIIADIHGNLFALDRVLVALDDMACDAVYCLGDLVAPGPWPAEVASRLRERDIPCVRGNTDDWVLAAPDTPVSDRVEMNDLLVWARGRLSDAEVAWLHTLPMTRDLECSGLALTLVHATPRATTEVISALTPVADLNAALTGVTGILVAGGHTHVQLLRITGARTLINPGSIGLGGVGPGTPDLPPAEPAPAAEFAVIDIDDGHASVAFHRVDLDVPAMLDAAAATGMPHHDWWSALWRR